MHNSGYFSDVLNNYYSILQQLARLQGTRGNELSPIIAELNAQLDELIKPSEVKGVENFLTITAGLKDALGHLQSSDWPATPQYITDATNAHAAFGKLEEKWKSMQKEIEALNNRFKKKILMPVTWE